MPRSVRFDRYAINAGWLMKLRWVAVVGQLSTIAVVVLALQIPIRSMPLAAALLITAGTNLVFTVWLKALRQRRVETPSPQGWNRVFLSLMVLDLVVLTLLLYFTGGHANPFSLFFFVNLALSGILLPPRRAWLLNAISIACFATLFYYQVPLLQLQQLESLQSIREQAGPTLGHLGLFVAFTACSMVIVYFITRLNTELRSRDEALRAAQLLRARSDKWEALGSLSAGAAHELATPLTTIAIVSKELTRSLASDAHSAPDGLVHDVLMIRRQVERCRTILNRMSIDAGHAIAEPTTMLTADALVEACVADMTESRHRLEVCVGETAGGHHVQIPVQSVCQALRAIIQNALDASTESVIISIETVDRFLEIAVTDRGTGMSPKVLKRADEPFFTTKDTGKGMGLGRFLARTVFERIGGTIVTKSEPAVGTTVTVQIPIRERKSERADVTDR